MERTLLIIKPDAVGQSYTGEVLRRVEQDGFVILGLRMLRLTTLQAKEFYAVHREKPFYEPLVKFMTSGPVVVCALERENAVRGLRELVGSTNPREAAPGTIRADLGWNVQENAVHASDSLENARKEVSFFFKDFK
jgi:nucleoside-diphosphate kinase